MSSDIFGADPAESAVTPVDIDHVESETEADANQVDHIEDQIVAAGGDGGVEAQEATLNDQAAQVTTEAADVARLNWAAPPPGSTEG